MRFDPIHEAIIDPATRHDLATRFWAKVERAGADDCWRWTGAVASKGYGNLKAFGRIEALAHRVSWALAAEASPGAAHVLHRCDNPLCVNPAHLSLGTNAENVAERVARGRSRTGDQRGERNPAAKLTWERAAEIRRRSLGGEPLAKIARDHGVSPQMVSRIKHGEAWVSGELAG